jgi:hypothetical protein
MRLLWITLLLPGYAGAPQKEPDVDLLKLIDPAKDAVEGTWRLTGGKLQTTGRPFNRIEIPYVPPAEYDLKMVVEKVGMIGSFTLGLAFDDTQWSAVLDAQAEGKNKSGLDLVEGNPFNLNETTHTAALFAEKRKSTLLVSVRKDRVTVTVDEKKIIDWKADYERLTLYPGWRVPHKNVLFLGSWTAIFRFDQMELHPVTGKGRALR